jgi:hypothetical protein
MDKRIRQRQATISPGERYPVQHDNFCKAGFHMTVFEPSYLERDGWKVRSMSGSGPPAAPTNRTGFSQ